VFSLRNGHRHGTRESFDFIAVDDVTTEVNLDPTLVSDKLTDRFRNLIILGIDITRSNRSFLNIFKSNEESKIGTTKDAILEPLSNRCKDECNRLCHFDLCPRWLFVFILYDFDPSSDHLLPNLIIASQSKPHQNRNQHYTIEDHYPRFKNPMGKQRSWQSIHCILW
jgi:hypothetical protein